MQPSQPPEGPAINGAGLRLQTPGAPDAPGCFAREKPFHQPLPGARSLIYAPQRLLLNIQQLFKFFNSYGLLKQGFVVNAALLKLTHAGPSLLRSCSICMFKSSSEDSGAVPPAETYHPEQQKT